MSFLMVFLVEFRWWTEWCSEFVYFQQVGGGREEKLHVQLEKHPVACIINGISWLCTMNEKSGIESSRRHGYKIVAVVAVCG